MVDTKGLHLWRVVLEDCRFDLLITTESRSLGKAVAKAAVVKSESDYYDKLIEKICYEGEIDG